MCLGGSVYPFVSACLYVCALVSQLCDHSEVD